MRAEGQGGGFEGNQNHLKNNSGYYFSYREIHPTFSPAQTISSQHITFGSAFTGVVRFLFEVILEGCSAAAAAVANLFKEERLTWGK